MLFTAAAPRAKRSRPRIEGCKCEKSLALDVFFLCLAGKAGKMSLACRQASSQSQTADAVQPNSRAQANISLAEKSTLFDLGIRANNIATAFILGCISPKGVSSLLDMFVRHDRAAIADIRSIQEYIRKAINSTSNNLN
jgi:hypothetical protein